MCFSCLTETLSNTEDFQQKVCITAQNQKKNIIKKKSLKWRGLQSVFVLLFHTDTHAH